MKYYLDERTSQRISSLKVISIVMVVFIHVYRPPDLTTNYNHFFSSIEYLISEVFCRIAVPMFFVLSSILLYRKDFSWKKNIQKKIKSIAIPYLLCNTIWIAVFLFASLIEPLKVLIPSNGEINFYISSWGLKEWLRNYLYMPFVYPLWFLKDLFLLNLLAKILRNFIDKFPKIILVIIFFSWILKLWIPSIINVFNLDNQSFVFFSLGYYFVKYDISFSRIDNLKIRYLLTPYLLLAVPSIFLTSYHIGIIKSINIIIGIFLLIRLTARFPTTGYFHFMIAKVSQYTFIIYAFHEFTLSFGIKISEKIFGKSDFVMFLLYFMLPLVVVMGCIFLGKIINKATPSIFTLITGGRVKSTS